MDSWSGAQRQYLSVVIYHTLFSHNEERFHQTGFKREEKKRRKKKKKRKKKKEKKKKKRRKLELEYFILQGL